MGLKDLHVSLKLSSTVFKTAEASDASFHFDKNGWVVPYPALIGLLNDREFEKFLNKVYDKYTEETELEKFPAAQARSDLGANVDNDNDNIIVDDDDDDDDIVARRKRVRVLSEDEAAFNDSGVALLSSSQLDAVEQEAAAACRLEPQGIS